MDIKKTCKLQTDDFWYDLFDGGGINPDAICAYALDADMVKKAIEVLTEFRNSCEEQLPDLYY